MVKLRASHGPSTSALPLASQPATSPLPRCAGIGGIPGNSDNLGAFLQPLRKPGLPLDFGVAQESLSLSIMRSVHSLLNVRLLSVAVLLGVTVSAPALPLYRFQDLKSFQQYAYKQSRFQGGQLYIALTDGVFLIAGCIGNGGLGRMEPNPFCELGTTALIVDGDFNGDGISDSQTYWSVEEIADASYLKGLRADLLRIEAAPPTDLPMPLAGFLGQSIRLFYDQINPPPSLYVVANYNLTRNYPATGDGLQTQRLEVVPGAWTVRFPIKDEYASFPDDTDTISVTHHQMIEAWPGRGVVPQTTDWLLLEPSRWNSDEEVELDPRLFNEFEWGGFGSDTVLSGDTTMFSMRDPITDRIEYPPYDPLTPTADREEELIDTPSYGVPIGPYLYDPGDKFIARIDFRRDAPTSGVASDTSRRLFEWNVYFIDTYEGYAEAQTPSVFPAGTPDAQKAASFDFDGDGWTNLEEFARQTDLTDPASKPNNSPFLIGPPGFQQCYFEVVKRPDVGSRLTYEIERSPDGISDWVTITPTDSEFFILEDSANRIVVLSKVPSAAPVCHLRVAISQS